jgi:hypothetical protein
MVIVKASQTYMQKYFLKGYFFFQDLFVYMGFFIFIFPYCDFYL